MAKSEPPTREEAIEILRAGEVERWNRIRVEFPEWPPPLHMGKHGVDLSGANLGGANLQAVILYAVDLHEADLSSADLRRATLYKADLHEAKLRRADIGGTILEGADLHEADLRGANLQRALLSRANLRGALLRWAVLHGADLRGAVLNSAIFGRTEFGWLDLSTVDGLECAEHAGPSTVGLDTLLASKGEIPDEFLRGCGYDALIQRVLVGVPNARAKAFYDWSDQGRGFLLQRCFVSYTEADKGFATRLAAALSEKGVDYWYAPEHAVRGTEIFFQVRKEIRERDRVIVVCSNASLNDSAWVETEIALALEHEREKPPGPGKRKIFPVMIDDALPNWSHEFKRSLWKILAGDFRGATKGQAFDRAVGKLIKGLKA